MPLWSCTTALKLPLESTRVRATVRHAVPAWRWIWTSACGSTGRTIPRSEVGAGGREKRTSGATGTRTCAVWSEPTVSRYQVVSVGFTVTPKVPSAAALTRAALDHVRPVVGRSSSVAPEIPRAIPERVVREP